MSFPTPSFTHLDFSDAFVHITPPRASQTNFFQRTPNFVNLLFLSQLPFFSPSSTADNLSILLELPFSSTISFTPPGHNWSIRAFVEQVSEDKDSIPESNSSVVSSGLSDLPPLENCEETNLRLAFSNLSLRQTGLLHLEPPYAAAIWDRTLPGYAQPTPTYFGRTTDSLALREAIDRAIVEYEEEVQRIGDVLSLHIALLRRVERDQSS